MGTWSIERLPLPKRIVWRHHALSCVSHTYLTSLSCVLETCYKCYPSLTHSNGILFSVHLTSNCRSRWKRGLRRGSAAPRLLELWVRIPSEAWMFVSCECCVLSGTGLCVGLITCPEESNRLWCVWVWSWILYNEVLDHWGLLCRGRKNNQQLMTLCAREHMRWERH